MNAIEEKIAPDMLQSYLHSRGWTSIASGPVSQLWIPGGGQSSEVLVPTRGDASDFQKRLRILLSDLVEFERRDVKAIESDIASIYLDVTNLRAAHPSAIDDSIPLQAGYELFASAHKILVASAAATIRRQGHFRNMPLRAREHAKNVRLGHTKRGSYVIPILSQARAPELVYEPNQEHIDLEIEETLFDRRVAATMSRALGTLQKMVSADRSPTASEMSDSIGEGVSRELCRAVGSVIKSDAVAEMDISFAWSDVTSPPSGATELVHFEKESEPLVKMVSEYLMRVPQVRQHVVYGVITELKRRPDENTGRVGLESLIDGRRKVVWMDLGIDSYHLAVRCHDSGTPVVVRGFLDNAPGRVATMDPTEFGPDVSLVSQKLP
ncbi:hypothetical protein ACFT39_22335 [[Kitasatospora] papulosa]|uniref:hypothetical protein n=1 Tax=[Kitasatospora] papulosa TaxID=1464011 RepID=UPI00362CC04F